MFKKLLQTALNDDDMVFTGQQGRVMQVTAKGVSGRKKKSVCQV